MNEVGIFVARKYKNVVYVTLLAGFVVLFLAMAERAHAFALLCHQLEPTSQIASGFGSPKNVAEETNEMLVTAECDSNWVKFIAGTGRNNTYVYEKGYEWNGSAWQEFTFDTGGQKNGVWYLGKATKQFSRTPNQLENPSYFVAYVCQWDGSAWKCGCPDTSCSTPSWQIQGYARPAFLDKYLPKESFEELTDVLVKTLFPTRGVAGTDISIGGFGFSNAGNTIIFKDVHDETNQFTVPNIFPTLGSLLKVQVPAQTRPGLYVVGVENANGRTETGRYFSVVTAGSEPPALTGITPKSGAYGVTVTLQGRNFTPTGNIVVTPFGTLRDIPSSDGTTLTFAIEPYKDFPEMNVEYQKIIAEGKTAMDEPMPLYFNVINANGDTVSSTLGSLGSGGNPTEFMFTL